MKAVSKTAWYCCGVRMHDAESPRPLIGDYYAKRLLGGEGMQYWQEFKKFDKLNASNTARHYIIDNHVKQALYNQPDSNIFLIGAGLDSRAYRFTGGSWIEIDEPAIIEYKNNVLPITECRNPLERIALDFERERLADKLSAYTKRPRAIFIIEGVLMYLSKEQKETLVKTLTNLFPQHTLICDLMKKKFFEKLGKGIHKIFVKHGTAFSDITDEPEELFLRSGYNKTSVIPTLKTANDLGLTNIPKFIVNILMRKLVMGYLVYTFDYRT